MLLSAPNIQPAEPFKRLQRLMFLRVVFVSILLGASIFVQFEETQASFGRVQTSHFLLIAAVYLLTFLYVIILKFAKTWKWPAYLQLLVDTVLVTAVIYATGGINSIFSFLYILTIVNASIILYRKGGLVVASSSSLLYALLLIVHYCGWLHPLEILTNSTAEFPVFHLFYLILVNIAAFYLVAHLSSYLSEQARRSRAELTAKEKDFNKLERLNERIINSINSGFIALDAENCIILLNPAAERIFGIERNGARGQVLDKVLPLVSAYLKREWQASAALAQKTHFVDFSFKDKEGQEMHLRFTVSPLQLPDGRQEGQILLFQDMTKIKRFEKEMKRVEGLALVGELAAGVAHEIRNPLASISGSIQMLKNGLYKDHVHACLMDIALREIGRLNHLVNDFLSFARPKKANLRRFEVNRSILDTLALFKNSGHCTENFEIRTELTQNIYIDSDQEQIRQVLWNLFLNACEAMPGGGSIFVKTEVINGAARPQEDRKVKIIVRDSGSGFDEKGLSQLFTPFFTTKEEGSGLGLAIVKRIMEGLQGDLIGRNHPQGGAEFTLLLPLTHQSTTPTSAAHPLPV
jgi:two-component system sensor histidine kinase PilS (NtrC family)